MEESWLLSRLRGLLDGQFFLCVNFSFVDLQHYKKARKCSAEGLRF
jgi:hypothetical protein